MSPKPRLSIAVMAAALAALVSSVAQAGDQTCPPTSDHLSGAHCFRNGQAARDCDATFKLASKEWQACYHKIFECSKAVDEKNKAITAQNQKTYACRARMRKQSTESPACDPATNAAAVKEARSGLDKVDKFIAQLRSLGLPVPSTLVSAVTHAASAGVDLGEAAGQVDAEVQKIVNDKTKLCSGLTEGAAEECEARVPRQWQQRNVEVTLDWKNTHSVLRRVVAKWTGHRCPGK